MRSLKQGIMTMKKRLLGLGLGFLASVSIMLVTTLIVLVLALTVIGLPLAILAGFVGAGMAFACPIVGFMMPDEVLKGAAKWPGHQYLGL